MLADEGVSTAYAIPTDRPTTISLVGLDTAGGARLPVLRQRLGRHRRHRRPTCRRSGPEVSGLHFGSYSLAATPVADAMAALAAANRDRFISVDPNVRPTVEPDMDVWRARLAVLFPLADLVKISAEDHELLWPGRSSEAVAADLIGQGVAARRRHRGRRGGARLDRRRASRHGARRRGSRSIDTVGAGDTFQAALLARLLRGPAARWRPLAALDEDGLAAILGYAARAAAITCSRRGADLPRAAELTD